MKIAIPVFVVLICTFPLTAAGPAKNMWQEIHESSDVARLETITSMTDAAPTMMMNQSAKEFRSQAYARLGALGTVESLAAVDRIEAAARLWRPNEGGFREGVLPHPGWHMGNSVVDSRIHATKDGVTYAVFIGALYGGEDLLLMSTRSPADPAAWFRPHLVPLKLYRGMNDLTLRASEKKGNLTLSFMQSTPPGRGIMEGTTDRGAPAPKLGAQSIDIDVAAVLRDTDGDGLTDVEEQRLGLRADKADTDGDGIRDGDDTAPDYAAPAETAEDILLLQKAFFATFGISGSRYTMFVDRHASVPMQPWGFHGQVIYGAQTKEFGGVSAGWEIKAHTGDKAEVEVWDGEGPLAGGSLKVQLEKKRGTWYVVAIEMGLIA